MRYLLHDVFIETAKKRPSNIAIISENGTKVAYKDLNRLSNKFANLFRALKNDVRENPYVGIISPVHIESIAAVLGTLKIGCSYVPLDEYSPTERLGHIIDNTNLDIIIVDSNWYENHYDLFDKFQIQKVIILGSVDSIQRKTSKCLFIDQVLDQSTKEPKI